MSKLAISSTLALPLDVVTQKLAFLGRTGSGKTYAATKLAELMLTARAQIVALDPVGKWHGLRLAGAGAGFEVPVFGGLHGDVPIEAAAGALIADVIADRGISAVLDVSQLLSSEQTRFATDFAKRFFQRKKTVSSAVHVFLEECQEFVPQNCQRGEEHMLHAFERLVKLGRNFGIGVSLISQRPQEVNKKALNQTECLFAFQMTGPHERKAMVSWMSDKGMDTKISDALPSLHEGECLLWSPSWLRVNTKIRVASKQTSDVSSTPKVGAKAAHAAPLTPIDIEALRVSMAATIERTKADDPRELRKKIAELEKAARATKPAAAAPPPAQVITVSVFSEVDINRLDVAARAMTAVATAANGAVERLMGAIARAKTAPAAKPCVPPAVATPTLRPKVARPEPTPREGEPTLGKCERAVLSVLATHGTRNVVQVAIQAGYTVGSLKNALANLRATGLITGGGDAMSITTSGTEAMGTAVPLPQGRALLDYWLVNAGGKCEREILTVAIDEYPAGLSTVALADRTGYTPGSLKNALARLRSLELITSRGDIALTETLGEAV